MAAEKIKLAVIAGASSALKYKDKHPRATEQEVLQHIADSSNEIISKIEDEEEF